jgi:hypothetical protein
VIQNAWLQAVGVIEERGVGAISRGNPALAVGKVLHDAINREQRALGLFNTKFLQSLPVGDLIEKNLLALRRAGVPDDTISLIAKEVIKYAKTLP